MQLKVWVSNPEEKMEGSNRNLGDGAAAINGASDPSVYPVT